MESLEDRINNSKEIKQDGFLSRIGRNKWLRRSVLPFAFPMIFGMSGCDGNGNGNNGPTSPNPPRIVESKVTNSKGTVSFTERGDPEKVIVNVMDSDNKPVPDFSVIYFDGDDSEVFMGYDPNEVYLPSMRIAPHNSQQLLYTVEAKRGVVQLQTIDDKDGMRALLRFENRVFPKWTEYIYEETIDESESIKRYEKNMAYVKFVDKLVIPERLGDIRDILHFIGAKLPLSFEDLAPILDPYGKRGAKRWDVYRVKGGSESVFPILVPDYIEVVESNIPTLKVDNPRVDGNKVTLSWQGSDKTFYDKPFPELWDEEKVEARPDLTVLIGTEKSDLEYFYKLIKDGRVVREDSTLQTQVNLSDLEEGDYNLEVLVRDEVGNNSSVERKNFKIAYRLFNGTIVFLDRIGKIYDPGVRVGILHNNGNVDYYLNNGLSKNAVSFSPIGRQIAYTETTGKKRGLWIVNNDGSNSREISDLDIRSIDWGGNDRLVLEEFWDGGIWVLNPSNGEGRKLIPNIHTKQGDILQQFNYSPKWSDDGKMIYFLRETLIGTRATSQHSHWEYSIHSINSDGDNEKRLMSFQQGEVRYLGLGHRYNDELLYTKTVVRSGSRFGEFFQELWTFNLNTGDHLYVAEDSKGGGTVWRMVSPKFIEDGRRILYFIDTQGFIINPWSSEESRLSLKESMVDGDWTHHEF